MWWRRRQTDEDFAEEIQSHIVLETERLVAEGMSPEDARRTALNRFGNVTLAQERFYESTRIAWLDRVQQDLRAARRSLSRYPVAATITALSLAGGIGATTTALMVREAIFLKPPPLYERPDQLSNIDVGRPERPRGLVPAALYRTWAAHADIRIAATSAGSSVDVRTERQQRTVPVRSVTPEFFDVLGVRPTIGQRFSSTTQGRSSAVLSYGIWQTLFDGRTDAIGQPLWIGDAAYTVIGVMPERFWFASMAPAIWLTLDPSSLAADYDLHVIVRRPATLNTTGLQQQLQRDVPSYVQQLPETQRQLRAQVWSVGGTPLANQMALVIPWILGAAVLLTLCIACANVAILMFVQWTGREHEIAVRASLGASRGRIVRLLLTESVLLATIGGLLGVCVTFALRGLIIHNAGPTAAMLDLSISPVVFLNAAALTLVTGVAAGVGPALLETRRLHRNPLRARPSERVRQWWRGTLVVAEITVTVALLVVTAALVDAYRRNFSVDLGFNRHSLVAARLENQSGIPIDRIVDAVTQLPGVATAAAATAVPLAGGLSSQVVSTDAAGSDPTRAERVTIGPGFFTTLGIPVKAGRDFTRAEATTGGLVAIVNETLARQLFPRVNPIGAHVWMDGRGYEIVGVSTDVATTPVRRFTPGIYLPLPQQTSSATRLQVVVRALTNPAAMVTALRREIGSASPGTLVTAAFALDDIINIGGQETLAMTYPLVPMVGMGLFLTASGIYAVLAYAIARRSTELALRAAIGATRFDLARLVTTQSARLLILGSALAVAATFGLTRLVRAAGGGGSAFDTPAWHAFVIPVLIVAVIGALATWVPTRRALRIDPAVLMRGE